MLISSKVDGFGAFNEYGYLSGDVKIPEGIVTLGEGVVYYGNYLKTLTLPDTLVSFDKNALCRGGKDYFPVNLQKIVFPMNFTKIGEGACQQIGTNLSDPVSITFLSDKNMFTLSKWCFLNGAVGEVIFESSNTSGTDIYIEEQALYGIKPLTIQLPEKTRLYLWSKAFSPNVDLQINLENVTSITAKALYPFWSCKLTDEQANMIISKLTKDSITEQFFIDCNSLKNIYFDYYKLDTFMFYDCGLSQITFSDKINTIMTSAIDTSKTEIFFNNLDKYKDNSIKYYSMYYNKNISINPATSDFLLDKRYVLSTRTSKPLAEAILIKTGSYNPNYAYYEWKYSKPLTEQGNFASSAANNTCQRGYGLWAARSANELVDNNEVYDFLTKIDQVNSGMFGILNGLKVDSPDLHLPYSSNQFWGGTDSQGLATDSYQTITFDTCGWDPTISRYSTGPHLFTVGGFNKLKKLIWKETGSNSVIRSHTLGCPDEGYRDSWKKSLQELEEVYFGEGATGLEPYIFACLFPSLYNTEANKYQYIYTYNSSWSICPFDYPMLKTLYLPGSIGIKRGYCQLVIDDKNKDSFYLHPLYCGAGNIEYLQNLDQILLGSGWSLSIELTSLCFRDKDNNPYYNLVLAPEAMIFNINNLKDCSNESSPKQLIVTNKTLYDLRIYCNQYQGQEKIILKGTQCEPTEPIIIPSYNNLIKLANDKNWEVISVAHSTWTSNLTDNADNLIIDANTNSITT